MEESLTEQQQASQVQSMLKLSQTPVAASWIISGSVDDNHAHSDAANLVVIHNDTVTVRVDALTL